MIVKLERTPRIMLQNKDLTHKPHTDNNEYTQCWSHLISLVYGNAICEMSVAIRAYNGVVAEWPMEMQYKKKMCKKAGCNSEM